MPSRISTQCTTRRKHSLGKLRRAHPASGATWNVQVVRGKMSSKCLWHACRALILGMVLMLLGAGMATVGYYADQLSVGSEIRGNSTIRVKNEARGFHLSNLSYVGPIVMGFGGFIVVASCVMTFEARDSAAKVVPARLKATTSSKANVRSNSSSAASQRRANAVTYQATRWDHHLGVFRSSPAEPLQVVQLDRQALTATLVHFSKTFGQTTQLPNKKRRFPRSGSVPNLTEQISSQTNFSTLAHLLSPNRKPIQISQNSYRRHRHHHHHNIYQSNGRYSKIRSPRLGGSLVQRTTRDSSSSFLQSLHYQKHLNAFSVDETGVLENQSMRIVERNKRSDTAKRHILSRQKPIENEDLQNVPAEDRRRSSTLSEASYGGRWTYKCPSVTSRTPSLDSKKTQVDLHSPESQRFKTTKRLNSGPSSTPSVEREFRSQISICSEPIAARQLSGQSSIEPCLVEESAENDEKLSNNIHINEIQITGIQKKVRPETLQLNAASRASIKKTSYQPNKCLYRSNSSLTFYRPKPKITNEYDSILFAKSNEKDTHDKSETYDSLQVINERRKKILKAESDTTLSDNRIVPNNCTDIKERMDISAFYTGTVVLNENAVDIQVVNETLNIKTSISSSITNFPI